MRHLETTMGLDKEDLAYLEGVWGSLLTGVNDPDFEREALAQAFDAFFPFTSKGVEAEVPTTWDHNFKDEVIAQLSADELWLDD